MNVLSRCALCCFVSALPLESMTPKELEEFRFHLTIRHGWEAGPVPA